MCFSPIPVSQENIFVRKLIKSLQCKNKSLHYFIEWHGAKGLKTFSCGQQQSQCFQIFLH